MNAIRPTPRCSAELMAWSLSVSDEDYARTISGEPEPKASKPKAAPKPRGKGSVALTTSECIEYLLELSDYDLSDLKTKTLFVMWELIKMLPINPDRRHIPGTTNRGQIEEFIASMRGHFSLFNPAAGPHCFKKEHWLVKRDTLRSYDYEFDESAWVEPKK